MQTIGLESIKQEAYKKPGWIFQDQADYNDNKENDNEENDREDNDNKNEGNDD